MKKLILIHFVIIGFTVFSQETAKDKVLTGFWGIDFGSTVDHAKNIMSTKNECKYSHKTDSERLVYLGGYFAGQIIDILGLDFYNGKFYNGFVTIIPSSESKLLWTFESLKEDISNKYFKPQYTSEKYDYPFEKGDGHELTAIKSDKASIGAIWYFDNAFITLLILKSGKIAFYYTESKTKEIVDRLEKNRESKDL